MFSVEKDSKFLREKKYICKHFEWKCDLVATTANIVIDFFFNENKEINIGTMKSFTFLLGLFTFFCLKLFTKLYVYIFFYNPY